MYFGPQCLNRIGGIVLCGVMAAAVPAGAAAAREQPPRREMSTDRPDSTESPFTLEPGRAQLEMSFASWERDRQDGVRTTAWEAAPFNLRFGLTPAVEAGLFIVPYQRVTEQARGEPAVKREGFGDLTLRSKWNLRGNDDPSFGLGLMLDVTLPTAPREFGPRKVEVAFTVPTAFDIGAGWGGGAMTSVQIVRRDDGARRPVWFNTLTAGRDIAGDLGGFIELASTAGDGSHVLTFNCGLTQQVNPDLQFDAGVNVGVSRSAPDMVWFAGVSRRF